MNSTRSLGIACGTTKKIPLNHLQQLNRESPTIPVMHLLTGGSIETALHITPWCHCEVEQLVRVTGSEGVVGVSDVTH